LTSSDEAALISFLRDCSASSLADFSLSKLNRDAELRKQLHSLLETMIENRAFVEVARILRSLEAAHVDGVPARFARRLPEASSKARAG
jgi:hypothetical protein